MKIYQIYDTEESYPYQKCELVTGTLKECTDVLYSWLSDHIETSYEDREEFYKEYPEVKLFIETPEKWIEKYGNDNVEVYCGWKLVKIYEAKEVFTKADLNKAFDYGKKYGDNELSVINKFDFRDKPNLTAFDVLFNEKFKK